MLKRHTGGGVTLLRLLWSKHGWRVWQGSTCGVKMAVVLFFINHCFLSARSNKEASRIWELHHILYQNKRGWKNRTGSRYKVTTGNILGRSDPGTDRRPNQEILVPDWLITSRSTKISSSDWLFTCFALIQIPYLIHSLGLRLGWRMSLRYARMIYLWGVTCSNVMT